MLRGATGSALRNYSSMYWWTTWEAGSQVQASHMQGNLTALSLQSRTLLSNVTCLNLNLLKSSFSSPNRVHNYYAHIEMFEHSNRGGRVRYKSLHQSKGKSRNKTIWNDQRQARLGFPSDLPAFLNRRIRIPFLFSLMDWWLNTAEWTVLNQHTILKRGNFEFRCFNDIFGDDFYNGAHMCCCTHNFLKS